MQYDEGDVFSQHTDNIKERIYVTGIQLNEDYEGGEYIFYEESGLNIINKKIGNCYISSALVSHEVKTITKGVRYSLVAFIERNSITDKTKKGLI
jgi:predicted 2-oxoglutarate/Fe(II)-dependent dioxygenase YbiX